MNIKNIRVALKYGNDIETMMEKYNFPSEEAFFSAIRRITPSEAEKIIKEFQRNQKSSEKKKAKVLTSTSEIKTKPRELEVEAEYSEQNTAESEHETVAEAKAEKAEEESKAETAEEKFKSGTATELAKLQEEEREISEYLCELEGEHKRVIASRKDVMEKLSLSKNALEELKRLLQAHSSRVTTLLTDYDLLANKMADISREIGSWQEILESVRGRIYALKKVAIFVYENGYLEIENGEIPSIENEAIVEIFNTLILHPEAEEYTVKQLKNIARLYLITKKFAGANIKYELVFDSLQVQKFFEAVNA